MSPAGCIELCPGCRYRGYSPILSNEKKQAWADRWLKPFTQEVSPIITSTQRWGYRRKALLHAELGPDGWRLGLLKRRGWESDLIEIPDCPLHAPELNDHFRALRLLLPRDMPLAFVLASGSLLTLVLKCAPSEQWRLWARSTEYSLKKAGVQGLQLNWNPSAGRRPVSSRHQEPIFGPRFPTDEEGHYYGALSFRQQLPGLEAIAMEQAENFLRAAGAHKILDLYCGSGPTLARWRRLGWNCVGVELSGEAVEAAEKNAPACTLLKGKVEQRIPQLNEWLGKPPESFVLYSNPPRDGHAKEVNEWILKAAPLSIAYLSCNQKSLARDLAHLSRAFDVVSASPFDFLPQTDHVESLALLKRK